MNKHFLLGLSFVAISLVACSKREIELDETNPTMVKAITENLIEANATSKSEKVVLWNPGDEIAVFSGELSGKFESTLKKKPSSSAVFRGDLGLEAWPEEMDIWAVYPYSEEAFFDGETITTVLPSEQIARNGEFGKDMNLAIAHSNTSILQFYNVGGGIRFSVTEEGIKKVMFEGLGGEIISGKVKIGFSEDGLPEIRKVISGSQFITILPPDGQEAFQKDTWYYIVVIPGSLDRGYKLRFYKDSDYARKVSNNALNIKRSFYRNLEKVDDGIEYGETTTNFPETEEEWIKSVELTQSIGEIAGSLIDSLRRNHLLEDAKETLRNIEGVLDVLVHSENGLIAIMQTDSIVVNYPDPRRFFHKPESLIQSDHSSSSSFSNSIMPNRNDRICQALNTSADISNEKKALILIPCEVPGSDYFTSHNKYLRNCLKEIGYDSDNIISLLGPDAEIKYFKGEELSKYDYIHITSHGSTGYSVFQPHGVKRPGNCFASATEYSASWAVLNLATKEIDPENIAMFYCDNYLDDNDDSKYYLCMTSSFLDNSSFDNSCVIVTACNSAEPVNGTVGGTILSKIVDKGAGIALGYLDTAISVYTEPFARFLTKLISHGVPFQNAVTYLKNAKWFNEYLYYHVVEGLRIDLMKGDITIDEYEDELKWISHNNAFYYPTLEVSSTPYYLHKLDLTLNESVVMKNGKASLSWEFDYVPFIEEFSYYDYSTYENHKDIIPFGVQYEIHIGENVVLTTNPAYEKSVDWDEPTVGDHSWYVVAKIKEGDTVIASYQSGIGYFTVTEESVAVNSVSLDKTNLELAIGNSATLKATILPSNATNKNVTWASSNSSVASVSSAGEVKGIAKGTATITVKTEDGGKTASCRVTVVETKVPVSGVSLNKTSLSMTSGDTQTLTATVTPSNASNKSVSWSSSNTSVATVSSSGVVSAKSAGSATITVTTNDGGKKASCSVTVKAQTIAVTGVSLNKTSLSMTVGDTQTLTATVTPSNATDKSVTWSSSNTSVATVSGSGVVTAKTAGSAIITVTTNDGGEKATCAVTVQPQTVAVTGVSLNKASLSMMVGETQTLTATVIPSNATNKTITWSSSNTSIITVSSTGVVTAKATGTATITVTTNDGGKKATCNITVKDTSMGGDIEGTGENQWD